MAGVEIPFEPSLPFQGFGITLDGIQYLIDARWNARADEGLGAWYFDLYTEDEKLIQSGIKITLGTFLGGRSADDRFPHGAFRAWDLTNSGSDATLDNLGTQVVVYFYTVAELAAL